MAEAANQTRGDMYMYNTSQDSYNETYYGYNDSRFDYTYYTGYYPYDDLKYKYQGFYFERPIYLYVWEILVIMTFLFNVVVISVLLRKKMRNPTYMILVAIAVSDSLTGLVTLPTYIAVFKSIKDYDLPEEVPPLVSYLSETLCDSFMISKFVLSKSFHTVSVWLTLFLGLQRFLSVFSPLQGLARVFTTKKTVIVCVAIFFLAPFLHVYHLFKDKSENLLCRWKLDTGSECGTDCVYLWLVLLLGHLLPAAFLTMFTVMFVYSLKKTTESLQTIGSSRNNSINSTYMSRQRENRRVSIIVTAIVIVFLIPEIPFCGFLLYNASFAHADLSVNLEANRAIHAAYEILLVLSFSANFYIYTFFNKRFRKVLQETVIYPVYKATCYKMFSKYSGDQRRYSGVSNSSKSGSAVQMTSLKTVQTDRSLKESSSSNTVGRSND